ncbi:S8 family peptidase [Cuneatibacter caecimuris]|uniref:Serine protease AprX n=1 Tax=Cuneatibacter caecimuris TaxID=1796618 RepID=A0A4Q7PMV2_9FIRM|nr:S8 family peptidase [Cuneatibacter caecimuris]RZT01240.1 serine protease AprX [Cuneatibacter caecimuris]
MIKLSECTFCTAVHLLFLLHRKLQIGLVSHVAGIIGGDGSSSDGRVVGMAPECSLVGVRVLDGKAQGSIRDMIAGIRWVLQMKDRYRIRVVNISVGSLIPKGMREDSALVKAVDALWDAGLIVCVAAGNRGNQPMSITTPGISRKVITVGSCDDMEQVDVMGSKIVHYSGRGPTRNCIMKPELVANGYQVMSCNAMNSKSPHPYCCKSGTSMATAQISGAIALLLSKQPKMSNVEIKLRIRECCHNLGVSPAYQGWGMLDLSRFVGRNG